VKKTRPLDEKMEESLSLICAIPFFDEYALENALV